MTSNFAVLSRIVNMSAFMLECAEEGEGGHSDAIAMMAVCAGSRSEQVKLARLVKDRYIDLASSTPLADAATRLADHLAKRELLQDRSGLSHEEIRIACAALERPFQAVPLADFKLRRQRSIARGIRFIWQYLTGAVPGNSRVFEMFVDDRFVPRGRSFADLSAGRHREHVVPCLWLYMYCREQLAVAVDAAPRVTPPPDLAAALLRDVEQLLVIVELSPDQAQQLDAGRDALKTDMPTGWLPHSGCAFARLHSRPIPFRMLPASLARFPEMQCTCGKAPGLAA